MIAPDPEKPTARQRYERALEALKQASHRLRRAELQHRKIHLSPYRAEVQAARQEYEAVAGQRISNRAEQPRGALAKPYDPEDREAQKKDPKRVTNFPSAC